MTRTVALLAFILLFLGCDAQSPTEPPAMKAAAQFGCTEAGAVIDTPSMVLRPGATIDVPVRVCYPPARLPWSIAIGPPAVAEGRATIEAGATETVLHVRAVGPGLARISYTVSNFGRAPSTRVIGEVRVGEGRRRAVR